MKPCLRNTTSRYEADRLSYDPAALVDFYEAGFGALGAPCERTWHDRLEIVAEGQAARLWNPDGALHEVELAFAAADAKVARDVVREVFPGCPLTFRLADALRPVPDPARWETWLRQALEADLSPELATVRARQEHYLRRELDRIDEYFANYEHELAARAARSASGNTKLRTTERLAAAKLEHARRRADQVARHEIRVQPHFDALLLVAERAWRGSLQVELAHRAETLEARFVPRARRWFRGY